KSRLYLTLQLYTWVCVTLHHFSSLCYPRHCSLCVNSVVFHVIAEESATSYCFK
ncbi:hypothetical protein C0J52_25780, partial [Blattella germanica]